MSFDVLSALQLAGDIAGKQSLVTTIGDIETIYGLYETVAAAGKFDLAVLAKSASFKSEVQAIGRTAQLVSVVIADPVQGPKLLALLESL